MKNFLQFILKKGIIFSFLILVCESYSFSQDNAGASFMFLTWHPGGDKMAFLQPAKLDRNANFVLNWGGVAWYERFVYRKRISIKFAQGAYSDCARLFAGHTHVGFRLNFLNSKKHSLQYGFGPTFVYRQSWYRFPGYVQQNKYLKTSGNWQYAFVWNGSEIEYDYKITSKLDIGLHIIPAPPDFLSFEVGVRYWLRPIPSNKAWRNQPAKRKWFYTQKDIVK